MAVEIDKWYDDILAHAPGATVAGIRRAVLSTLGTFLRRSGAYAKDLPAIALRAGRSIYTIPRPQEGPVLYVYDLYCDGLPLTFLETSRWLLQQSPVSSDRPVYYRRFVDDPARFQIDITPANDGLSIVPYVAIGFDPECSDRVPEFFLTEWYDTILSGAVSRLCGEQNKPYTDASQAALHGRRFNAGIAAARDMARKQFTRAETPVTFPKWA